MAGSSLERSQLSPKIVARLFIGRETGNVVSIKDAWGRTFSTSDGATCLDNRSAENIKSLEACSAMKVNSWNNIPKLCSLFETCRATLKVYRAVGSMKMRQRWSVKIENLEKIWKFASFLLQIQPLHIISSQSLREESSQDPLSNTVWLFPSSETSKLKNSQKCVVEW